MSANHISDQRLIFKTYKDSIQLNSHTHKKIQTILILNLRTENLNRLFQRRHTDGHKVQEKMLNSSNHQGNTNQNHSEVSLHTCQDDYNKDAHVLVGRWREGNHSALLMGK